MPERLQAFRFDADTEGYERPVGFCAELAPGISTEAALFQALYDELQLPGYFGFNWDALFDCLRDLHWLEEKVVVLAHRDLPAIGDGALRTYLQILADAVCDWAPDEEHELVVIFPRALRGKIALLLRDLS